VREFNSDSLILEQVPLGQADNLVYRVQDGVVVGFAKKFITPSLTQSYLLLGSIHNNANKPHGLFDFK